jgi:hypothetical protein
VNELAPKPATAHDLEPPFGLAWQRDTLWEAIQYAIEEMTAAGSEPSTETIRILRGALAEIAAAPTPEDVLAVVEHGYDDTLALDGVRSDQRPADPGVRGGLGEHRL